MSSTPKRIAIIGAGWAGLAAAIELIEAGHQVSVFEAARQVGGRARSLEWQTRADQDLKIDNGQHILIGAYQGTLDLMKKLGIDPDQVMRRIPFRLEAASGFRIRAPRLPAPFHLVLALLGGHGLKWTDRLAALQLIRACRKSRWQLQTDCSVDAWLQQHAQPPMLCKYLWIPLCIAALNTPPAIASAQVFLNVLRSSVGADRSASDLLLPSGHLGTLLPEAALAHLRARASIQLGSRVTNVIPDPNGIRIQHEASETRFDAAVIAVSAQHVSGLLAEAQRLQPSFNELIRRCEEFSWQPITTVYLLYPQSPFKPGQPAMLMLDDDPAQDAFGQWIFDRQRLSGETGLVAVVISADGPHRDLNPQELATRIAAQIRTQLGFTGPVIDSQVITEKRASFSCLPNLQRPHCTTPDARIVLAGDYIGGDPFTDLPATLESAVRSGVKAARHLTDVPADRKHRALKVA